MSDSRWPPAGVKAMHHGAVQINARCVIALTPKWPQVDSVRSEARYGVDDDRCGAEFALLVDARWQRRGVGAWAMRPLQHAAARSGLQWLHGDVLAGNAPMLGLMRRCGLALSPDPDDDGLVQAQRWLWPNEGDAPPLHLRRSVRSWLRHPLSRVTAVATSAAR